MKRRSLISSTHLPTCGIYLDFAAIGMLHIELVEDELDDDIVLESQNLRDPLRDPRLDRPQVDLRHINLRI